MGKQKTHKATVKRIRITGTGKVKRGRANRSHLMSSKSGKRRRQLRRKLVVTGASAKHFKARS